jgi:hypothetical protein
MMRHIFARGTNLAWAAPGLVAYKGNDVNTPKSFVSMFGIGHACRKRLRRELVGLDLILTDVEGFFQHSLNKWHQASRNVWLWQEAMVSSDLEYASRQ